MPSPIPGYITKKQIEERHQRSHRSLTRDFTRAVRIGDDAVLKHLKLCTEDGVVREGAAMTLDKIQELSNKGLMPTWYAEGEWADRHYAIRTRKTSAPQKQSQEPAPEDEHPEIAPTSDSDLLSILRQQIAHLEIDKRQLRKELEIKNEQIRDANARTRESNALMKDLQQMLSSWQQKAFESLPNPTPDVLPQQVGQATPVVSLNEKGSVPVDKANHETAKTTKSTPRTPKRRPASPPTKKASRRPSSKTKASQPPKAMKAAKATGTPTKKPSLVSRIRLALRSS